MRSFAPRLPGLRDRAQLRRIQALEAEGAITGYRALFDVRKSVLRRPQVTFGMRYTLPLLGAAEQSLHMSTCASDPE